MLKILGERKLKICAMYPVERVSAFQGLVKTVMKRRVSEKEWNF
jgi:hypothetical protein